MTYRLSGHSVLRLGPNARQILGAYTCNVPEAPRSAFLDRSGRIVAVVDQILLPGDEALLVLPAEFCGRLRAHLAPYLNLADARLSDTDLLVYFNLAGETAAEGEIEIPCRAGRFLLSRAERACAPPDEAFTRFRLDERLPIQGVDYDREMPLNLDDPSLVHLQKGCYLGQEIVSRVHYRSRPPRRLIVDEVPVADWRADALTSRVESAGRVRGFRFTETDGPGSGRLEEALRRAFDPSHLEVIDESRDHAGHLDAGEGPTHWRVTVVSAAFERLSPLDRHRAVYAAAGLTDGPTHALAVRAMTPAEWAKRGAA